MMHSNSLPCYEQYYTKGAAQVLLAQAPAQPSKLQALASWAAAAMVTVVVVCGVSTLGQAGTASSAMWATPPAVAYPSVAGPQVGFSQSHFRQMPAFGPRTARAIHPQMAEMRAGDVGENGGEAYFPTSATETVEATGEVLSTEPPMRIGHGWDIHRLTTFEEAGQGCVLGGVTVPNCDLGVVAHSDGDVLYHSLTDSLLGALGLPDIGQLFPDNDPRWRGADSEAFLEESRRLMEKRGYRISNVDITLVLQKPRVAPIKEAMKANVVRVLQTVPSRVNIKARTHEKVDSIGEGRALSCHAMVILEKI